MHKFYFVPIFLLFFMSAGLASANGGWEKTTLENAVSQSQLKPIIESRGGKYFTVNFGQLYNEILNAEDGYIVALPGKGDQLLEFELKENTTMSSGLNAKFPEIKSFNIVSVSKDGTWGKLDISPKGIFAVYQSPGKESVYLDPLFLNETQYYVLYDKSQYISSKTFECEVSGITSGNEDALITDATASAPYNTCELRTYRAAIAATGEYTQFHGGTVALAMAAIVTTLNRVNMIYERDFAVTLELVPDNDQLVFTNSASDPYTNGNAGVMLNQNSSAINTRIGSGSYDIGHVFGTNSGGLAGLGVVCSTQKAQGVTGSNAPIGDAFDIDYVAHEMGHQFGANHTFNNSCSFNRNNSTAMEPGSGSTIMAYAGICNPNVQFNSDPYFHGISLREIGIKINGYTCGTTTALNNVAPVIESISEDVYLPISTPFALTATAYDDDEDNVLTYNWEQMDNQISTQPPVANATNGPNFRSFDPDTIPTRYFPKLTALASSPSQTWERLPSVARKMKFRVSVRDNNPGGGCTQYDDTEVNFVAEAGPFKLTYPNIPGISWNAFTEETVTWDVANTDQAPISCNFVNIYLSVDAGKTYPILLKENVPNTGNAVIDVPNYSTTTARVMVMSDAGTFFDISYNNFTINGIDNGFYLKSNDNELSECINNDVSFVINAHSVGNFDGPVSLSLNESYEGITAVFDPEVILPGQSAVLTFSNSPQIQNGVYHYTILGNSGDTLTGTTSVNVGFNALEEDEPELISPENEEEYIAGDVEFIWTPSSSPDARYQLQVALDVEFTEVVYDVNDIEGHSFTIMGLDAETDYYWRVMVYTDCGSSDFSEVYEFFTHTCFEFVSDDVPVTLPSFINVRTSEIEITSSGIITDVNIPKIKGTHGRISDLTFELISPQGTKVILAKNICEDNLDFNFGFDDASALDEIDCPPTTGNIYVPQNSLSAFSGEDSQGIWMLRISDDVNGGAGNLEYWDLEICVSGSSSYLLTANDEQMEICQNSTGQMELNTVSVFGYNADIELFADDLPAGVSASFNPQIMQPDETGIVELQVSNIAPGIYNWTIRAQSGDMVFELPMQLIVNEQSPVAVELTAPQNDATASSSLLLFEWNSAISPSAQYTIEFAYDNQFSDVIGTYNTGSETFYHFAGLPPVSTIFWRVITQNGCGQSVSSVNKIYTAACDLQSPDDLPKNILSIPVVMNSQIDIPYNGEVVSVSVVNLSGTHIRVSDLSARLISPSGTSVSLFSEVCGSDQNFNLSFADGGIEEIACPPTSGDTYQPLEPLSAFEGENAQGIWKLELKDAKQGAGGVFQNWALEICYDGDVFGFFEANPYNLNIFPNPTTGLVNIDIETVSGLETIALYDMTGRLLKNITVSQSGQIQIDLSVYASGVYFIRASGLKGTSGFKVIKTQ